MWKKIVRIVSLLVVLIICGCSSKYALSPSEFKIQMENNKYKVVDVMDSYQYEGLRKAYKAFNKNYDITYFKLETKEQAINFYESSQVNLNLNKISNKKETNISTKYYGKYTLTTSDSYLMLSRIDNTVIYTTLDKKYKDSVKKIIKRIGY